MKIIMKSKYEFPTFPSALTLESIENLPLIISAFITDSDGCSPLRLLPSKGSRPFSRANSTTPKDHTSKGGPIPLIGKQNSGQNRTNKKVEKGKLTSISIKANVKGQ